MIPNKVVDKNGEEIKTNVALHPGSIIEMELNARAILRRDFAAAVNILPGHVSVLLKGKRNVDATMAIKLEQLLKIRAEYWLYIQMIYDLKIARHRLNAAA